MQLKAQFAAVPSNALAVLGLIWLCLLMAGTAGCRFTGRAASTEPQKQNSGSTDPGRKAASGNPSRTGPPRSFPAAENPATSAARSREEKINADLERVSAMLKGKNYEGALREAERVQRDNPRDPNVTMRTSYLKAMIFHRMNDGNRRKEAMDQMLKSMEELQKDPRFRAAHEDGVANSEIIKMSIEQSGSRYGSN